MMSTVMPIRAAHERKLAYFELPGPPLRRFFLYRPSIERRDAPIVVSVHGIARNAAAHAYRFVAQSERLGVPILAPYFSKEEYGQYQQLEDRRLGVRSDHALLAMLEETARLSRADASRVLLFGYSGGAQFAHRFAMAHPDRVASVALASAGWYTFPDLNARYPAGLDTSGWTFEQAFEPSRFLRVPFHVSVGEFDVLRDDSLRKGKAIDSQQGLNRVERAACWTKGMTEAARNNLLPPKVSIRFLPSVGHDFGKSIERAGLADWAFECFEKDAALSPHKK